jgi:hypothetical protein
LKVIKKLKKTVLLEADTGYRFYVPRDVYEDDEVTDYTEYGVPYSLQFDLILSDVIDTVAIANDLYRAGIHTKEDVLSNRKAVNDVLRRHVSGYQIIHTFKGEL